MKNISFVLSVLFSVSLIFFSNCDSGTIKDDLKLTAAQKDTVEAATNAYIAGFPLVIMEATKNQFISPETRTNKFALKQSFVTASDTSVVRPNVDTYYSIAFLDLTKGPQVLKMPSTIIGGDTMYYMMPMLDAYTNVFKSPGTRTGYVNSGKYLIVGPQDADITTYKKDKKINEIFYAPTNLVWILGRFEVDDSVQAQTVVGLQNEFTLSPYKLSIATEPIRDSLRSKVERPSPNQIIDGMSIDTFFNQMNHLLRKNPLTPSDPNLEDDLVEIGVGTGKIFKLSSFSSNVQRALKNIPQNVIEAIQLEYGNSGGGRGWTVNLDTLMGNYGTDYFLRAVISYEGLGANQIEDAVYYANTYDSEGTLLDGKYNYTLTFPKGEQPPVDAFWSLTMYNEKGNLCENSINRYVLGHNTDEPFTYNSDGSLTLYIGNAEPDTTPYNNWLPAPAEHFNVLLRAYYPREAILDSTWTPPNFINID